MYRQPLVSAGRAREKFRWPRCGRSDRTLTSFASGFLEPRGAVFSRSIAKLSKLSNRGQRAYNAKVRNRETRGRGACARGRASLARYDTAEVLRPYNIPRTSCHLATAFQWLMSAFESTLGTVRYTLCYIADLCEGILIHAHVRVHTRYTSQPAYATPPRARTYHPSPRICTRTTEAKWCCRRTLCAMELIFFFFFFWKCAGLERERGDV